jgi:hypothetical protein
MPGRWWGVVAESEVPELARAILAPSRRQPIIVVTTPSYTDPAHVPAATLAEAEELRGAVGDIADIAIVPTGAVSFALDDALPDKWHIFNGACRSYPAGIIADPDIRRSPLRRRRRGEIASEQVISDALGQALATGILDQKPTGSVTVNATVKGFLPGGEQALADVGSTMPAVIWRDTTSPGIPLDWLVTKGSVVPGELDRTHNRLMLRKPLFGPAEFLAAYPHGSVTLALVARVSADSADLRVHPDLTLTVHRPDVSSNPLDVLDLFFVEGEVVRVRAVHLSTGSPHLRLIDVDDDEPVLQAATVVIGGTPWLVEGRVLPVAGPVPEEPTTGPVEVVEEQHPEPSTVDAAPHPHPPLTAPLPGAPRPAPATPTPVGPGALIEPAPPAPRPMPGPGPRPALPTPSPGPAPTPPAPQAGAVPATPADTGPTATDRKTAVQGMSMKIAALTADNQRLAKAGTDARAAAAAAQLELAVLKLTHRDTLAALGEAQKQIEHLKDLQRKAVLQFRRTRKPQPAAEPTGPQQRRNEWPNDDLWLRDEIHRAWVDRIPRVDKLRHPLPDDYVIGPRFLESLDTLTEPQFDKAMKCIVDVLTDRAKDIAGRKLHRLRTGEGGDDSARTRPDDGAVAWRAAIEINAAAARRLHYWAIGSRIELAQVGVHDDTDA